MAKKPRKKSSKQTNKPDASEVKAPTAKTPAEMLSEIAEHQQSKTEAVNKLFSSPKIQAHIKYHASFQAARKHVFEKSAPYVALQNKLQAEQDKGPRTEERQKQISDLSDFIDNVLEPDAWREMGWVEGVPPGTPMELLAELRSVERDVLFDLAEAANSPRPTDGWWKDAENLIAMDPFLPPLPSKPENGRQRYAALARWCESQTETEALKLLASREQWGVDELPMSIDLDTLRCLDDRELIECRYVIMNNTQRSPADPISYSPSPSVWYSPMRIPSNAGDWKTILSKCTRDAMHHPAELRVSERGRAELSRLRRGIATPARSIDDPKQHKTDDEIEWISSTVASETSGLDMNTLLKRSKKDNWRTRKIAKKMYYKHSDLRGAWPDKKFRPD